MTYEWDPKKASSNLKKHGVSFESAVTMLESASPKYFSSDMAHDERSVVIGLDSELRCLVVIIVEKTSDVTRIISARRASKVEEQKWEKQKN